MKHFVLISSIAAAAILIFFSTVLISQDNASNIKTFHSSIKKESGGNYKGALEDIQKIYNQNQNNYLVNLRLGWLFYNLGDYGNSKKYYSAANKINPCVESKLGLVYPLAALNEWDAVKKTYSEIIKLDNYNYTANLRLGQIYLNTGDFPNAKLFLEKVYKFYPGEYEPNLSLGYTYYYLGDNQKAKDLLTKALMLNPEDTLASEGLKLVK